MRIKAYYIARPCGWYYNDMRVKTIIEYRMHKGYYLCVCAKTYYTARPCGWYYNDMRVKTIIEYGGIITICAQKRHLNTVVIYFKLIGKFGYLNE